MHCPCVGRAARQSRWRSWAATRTGSGRRASARRTIVYCCRRPPMRWSTCGSRRGWARPRARPRVPLGGQGGPPGARWMAGAVRARRGPAALARGAAGARRRGACAHLTTMRTACTVRPRAQYSLKVPLSGSSGSQASLSHLKRPSRPVQFKAHMT